MMQKAGVSSLSPSTNLQSEINLWDVFIECSSAGADHAALKTMEIVVDVPGKHESKTINIHLQNISLTMWKYNGTIELPASMPKIRLFVRSEEVGNIGYVDLTKAELRAFRKSPPVYDRFMRRFKVEMNRWTTMIFFAIGTTPINATSTHFQDESATVKTETSMSDILKLDSDAERLYKQFTASGNIDDLNTAVALFREVCTELPVSGGNQGALNNLATALWTRSQVEGSQKSDLDEAIFLLGQALEFRPIPHPLRPTSLNNLATALWTRFEQGGPLSDLNKTISFHRQALELEAKTHPLRSTSLNNLASALWAQFKRTSNANDLDEAISLHRQALDFRPPPHPDRSVSLNNLAAALWTRFKEGGERSDMHEAISFYRQALELFPPPHPLRSGSLHNLADALSTRFEDGGQQNDLDEAIQLFRQAIESRPPPHPLRSSSFHSLATALLTRFKKEGPRNDLLEAILLYRQALDLLPPAHPFRSSFLINLANALLTQFQTGGQQNNLADVISMHRQALELLPPSHPLRSRALSNLASVLSINFGKGDQKSDLDEANSLYRQALMLQPLSHPVRSYTLASLGKLFMSAHLLFGNKSGYLEQAMSAFSEAMQCRSESTSQRMHNAKTWADFADLHGHPSAIAAYDAALEVLPQLAALGLDIQTRQEALTTGSDGLARKAARFAIRGGSLDKAVEFLEAGRAIFWSQVLNLRSPFEQLREALPEFKDTQQALQKIATALERGSHRDMAFVEILDNQAKMTLEQEATRLDRLSEEWSKGIDKIRRLKGFEDFLRPRRLSSLQAAAADGPVVMIVANDDGSHCLILTSSTVRQIPIPSLPTSKLRKLVYLIQTAASQSKILRISVDGVAGNTFPQAIRGTLRSWVDLEEKRGMRYEGHIPSDEVFRSVLKTLWSEVVKPVIDCLGLQNPPVLQWCPTGLFTFLPIHAAGCYDQELAVDCASDYIVSSYSPTIGVLLPQNGSKRPPSSQKFEMMVIVDTKRLSFARKELKTIKAHVPNDYLVQLGISGAPAHADAIISRLSTSSIVHFACHAKQDKWMPLNSALLVEGGEELTISKIMQKPLPNGSLAFLCACETAMGDENLPDEAMSLGASLLFSGFRRVVATMWEMHDKDGPTITDAFYEELFRGPDGKTALQPDTSRSAQALHLAVKKLRSGNDVSFRRWVPFIHMGR